MMFSLSRIVRVYVRRISLLFLLFILLLSCLTSCGTSTEPDDDRIGWLQVLDGKLCSEDGRQVQLRGVSTHGIAWYGEFLNANAMLSIKKSGGNVVRIAMYTDGEGGYVADPDVNLERVIKGIEDATACGMYVIVDWHILSDGDPNAHLTEAITFFDAIASRYRDLPNVIYEICNEPNGVSWDRIKDYAYAIVPVIRQYNSKAVIILGMPDYSSQLSYGWIDPFTEGGILYSYHFYAGEHSGFGMLKQAVENNLPLFVSEWGIGEKGMTYAEEFVEYLNDNGISWCAWSLCNKEEPYSMIRSDSMLLGGWNPDDLTDAGIRIFEWMGDGAN
jgi:endoglucanase